MTTDKEKFRITYAELFDKKYFTKKKVKKRTKELAQELRKRNPYNTRTSQVITFKWIGFDECCDEFEKMEGEKK